MRQVRPTLAADFEALLRLNRESEAVLSPLTLPRLDALIAQSWHHRVACLDGQVQAFLIALRVARPAAPIAVHG